MPAFLASLIKAAVIPLVQWVSGKVIELIEDWHIRKQIKAEVKKKYEAIKKAKTPDEIKKAHKDNISI